MTVRIFSAPPSADRCGAYDYGTNNYVASYTTGSDGFYFFWQKNVDNTGLASGTNTLASGYKYYIALCDQTGLPGSGTAMPFAQLYWPARSLNNTLGNKEFDEEDFFVSGPTSLAYQSQPTSARNGRTMGTVKVALLDGFGNVMTVDRRRILDHPGHRLGRGRDTDIGHEPDEVTRPGHGDLDRPEDHGRQRRLQAGRGQLGLGRPRSDEPPDQPHALTAGPLDPAVPAGPSPVGTTGRSGACAQEQPPERGDQRGDDDGDEPRRSRVVRVHGDCDRTCRGSHGGGCPDPRLGAGFGLKLGGSVPDGGVGVGEPAGAAVGGGTLTVIVPLRPPIVSA